MSFPLSIWICIIWAQLTVVVSNGIYGHLMSKKATRMCLVWMFKIIWKIHFSDCCCHTVSYLIILYNITFWVLIQNYEKEYTNVSERSKDSNFSKPNWQKSLDKLGPTVNVLVPLAWFSRDMVSHFEYCSLIHLGRVTHTCVSKTYQHRFR